MKKLISVVSCFAMILCMVTSAPAVENKADAREAQHEVIEAYNALCERYGQDGELAMKELLSLYPSLEVVDSSVRYFDDQGKTVLPTRSNMTDINLMGDQLIYDNDWDTYVYFGYWKWNRQPDEVNVAPYDVVGFYTQSTDEMYPLEYYVYGYNMAGKQVAYYNTESGKPSDYLAKGEETVWGAAFWIDDIVVREGRIVVPIDYTVGSNKKVMTMYGHSWTQRNVTGIGGEVNIDGGGFNVSWQTDVKHWESPVSSGGVRLP